MVIRDALLSLRSVFVHDLRPSTQYPDPFPSGVGLWNGNGAAGCA